MPMHRRQFLEILTGSVLSGLYSTPLLAQTQNQNQVVVKAIAFDAFPIFDPRPIFSLAETLFPGKGQALSKSWRNRQFQYQWLRALSDQYVDFWQATEAGLRFAASQHKITMSSEQHDKLMEAYLKLKPWPDVVPALQSLRKQGIRLVFLSNMTAEMLKTNIGHSGIGQYFEHVISTDLAKTYKPSPHAYELGTNTLRLKREEIVFAAFAGWDVAGAVWFGYPTFWVNRAGFTHEQLGTIPGGEGRDLNSLVAFVKKRMKSGQI